MSFLKFYLTICFIKGIKRITKTKESISYRASCDKDSRLQFENGALKCDGKDAGSCGECEHMTQNVENGDIIITCFGTPDFKCDGSITLITTSTETLTEKITTKSKGVELDDEKIKKCSGIIMQVLSNRIYDQDNIYS